MGLLVGNLGCEEELAAGPRSTPPTLPVAARLAAGGFATLLRAFAAEGDTLWTPERVDPRRIVSVPGLPIPRIAHGRLERLEPPPDGRILAWGETPSVSRLRSLRSGACPEVSQERGQEGEDPGGALPGRVAELWRLPAPPAATVARVQHRAFALELAQARGWSLPGARTVETVPELIRHLADGGAVLGTGAPWPAWVAKAPLSAAGRHRVIGREPEEAGRPAVRRRLERLLDRFGSLVVEPWVARRLDVGCSALVRPGEPDGEARVEIAGIHRLRVDRRGAFLGLDLRPGSGGGGPDGLRPAERARLEAVAGEVGRRLAAGGYSGPFGVDAFRWCAPDGEERFHPLSEINARLTFGWVAQALAERLDGAGGMPFDPAGGMALRFGTSLPDRPGAVPLLLPGDGASGGAPGAWIEPV